MEKALVTTLDIHSGVMSVSQNPNDDQCSEYAAKTKRLSGQKANYTTTLRGK